MRRFLLLAALLTASCSSSDDTKKPPDPGPSTLLTLTLSSVNPSMLLPGTRLVLEGGRFVPDDPTRLKLGGTFNGSDVEIELPVAYVSESEAEVEWAGGIAMGLPSDDGTLSASALVEIDNSVDGRLHISDPIPITLEVRPLSDLRVDTVQTGVIFVNDPIMIEGDGFLMGGNEGDTLAIVDGCFRVEGSSTCAPIATTLVPARPTTAFERTRVAFPFRPEIAGIHPGTFQGSVTVRNRHGDAAGGEIREAPPHENLELVMVPTRVLSVSPSSASLGQYVKLHGGGFVGTEPGSSDPTQAATDIALQGSFLPEGSPAPTDVGQMTLITEFVNGQEVRYVLSEQDDLGQRIDLRKIAGDFTGTVQPNITFGPEQEQGDSSPIQFSIGHIKQVVWINFLPAYVTSLRHFGLRAVDQLIRDRVLEVAKRDYGGTNVEFRTEKPDDFKWYAQVDLAGQDPNGFGLLGYDNTPGKDIENERLYDKIGGVNATTQEDGYPGYGGVFVESFFGFSEHPGTFAKKLDGSDPVFDQVFDPFRPDLGGIPVNAQDFVLYTIPPLTEGSECPAAPGDRGMQIACAVFALGSMIGSTMTHEVGHSIGLADPYGGEFHNLGDEPNRLMDGGRFRPFVERVEMMGLGPSVFCDEDYEYLKKVLPSSDPDPSGGRPPCW